MIDIHIFCPVTGRPEPTGISAANIEAFDSFEFEPGRFKCSQCGQEHIWGKEEAVMVEGPFVLTEKAYQAYRERE